MGISSEALHLISNYYFDGKGKAIRPVIILLMARALNSHLQGREMQVSLRFAILWEYHIPSFFFVFQHIFRLLPSQQKVAMAVEMIHTATLIHDDVLDDADLRRGKPSVNSIWDHRPVKLIPF